jgi:hypothetical protein
MSELKTENSDQSTAPVSAQIPACQKCGRQDETLRLVVFPFVVSIVLITFRRSFRGLWCKTHQRQQQLIAGLISSLFGWIGIPFGVIYTPISVLQLAKGGIQPADANTKILSTLAEDKINKGDMVGATCCLEECLKFRDDAEIKKRLNQIRSMYGAEAEPIGCIRLVTMLVRALFFGILIGTGIGILDYIRSFVASLIIGSSAISIILAILAYTPLIAAIYLGGLGLSGVVEKTLLRIKSKALGLAIFFGIISGLSVIYGIFEGLIIADNVYLIISGQIHSIGQMIGITILTLLAGGFFEMAGLFGKTGIIFSVILALAVVFFLWIGIWKAIEMVRWQQRKDNNMLM